MFRKLVLTLATLALCAAANAASLDEAWDHTFEVKPGTSLVLSNVNGSVKITAWDRPQIRVHALKHVGGATADAAKKAMQAIRIEVGQTASSVTIKTRAPNSENGWSLWDLFTGDSVQHEVTYEISVPRSLNVNAETVNGPVTLTGLNGVLKAETTNGSIGVAACSGALTAETTNGKIQAQLQDVKPNSKLSLETTNGSITLDVPQGFAARLDAETTNGTISSDIPVATTGVARNELHGTINGGGNSTVTLSTTNGAIHIRQSAKTAAK